MSLNADTLLGHSMLLARRHRLLNKDLSTGCGSLSVNDLVKKVLKTTWAIAMVLVVHHS